jgi:predicted aspartyl protease
MKTVTRRGKKTVGRITVDFQVTNNDDMILAANGVLAPEMVRRQTIRGLVDTGAAMLVLPPSVAKQLGFRAGKNVVVRYADDRRSTRAEVKGVHVEILGRDDVFSAIVEPRRKEALIGAIVLEALDLLADSKNQSLIPRDPSGIVFEIG